MPKKDNELVQEALENARSDRTISKLLLVKILEFIQENNERHKDAGYIAAKYLETLQRSNDQIVKIAQITPSSSKSNSLSSEDKDDLYDVLDGNDKKEGE